MDSLYVLALLGIRDREILELKSKVAEVLAVMPGMDLNLNISIGSPLDLSMDHVGPFSSKVRKVLYLCLDIS